MMLSSLLLLQFNSHAACYDVMTELKLNHHQCHENNLRFTKRELRNKINLMETGAPLRYMDDKPKKIMSIERLNQKITFGQNGLISGVTQYTDDLVPQPLF